ncbi:MAG: (Fe-S)-binding protein [Sulfobacillus acidophilus]|uniref:Glycolate oxidase iron-sulfur subunit n=1 Tax=Sulfobacillus acidophilus TaxID=53633 RepID=A0A2T2WHS9_9FIRM|nr:MAG: (Fe-S)-binding protein [Sulfobacillus acidophilus]
MADQRDIALTEINHCNKCGFCLPACPTYRLTGNEVDSPRGRIALVEGVLNDEIAADEGLELSLSYCLGCRACETACPSGVQYHRVLEAGKAVLDRTRPRHRGMTVVPRTLLRLTKSPKRMAQLARWSRHARKWPVPRRFKELLPMLTYQPESIPKAARGGTDQGGVAFFRGCVQEALFHDANEACKQLLEAVGYEVQVPLGQTCCGALAWHAGHRDEARALARRNIEEFEATGQIPIVNTAGGCGAMLSEYGEVLADDEKWAQRADKFSARVRDWSGVIADLPQRPRFVGAGERVTLQNSCHLVNVEGGGDIPARLLGEVQGDTFVPYASQDRCCGSAGIYNIQHPDWALRLLDQKMVDVSHQTPDRVIVVNPGCELQMTLGVNRAGLSIPVEHLARYLYRAFLRGQRESENLHQV